MITAEGDEMQLSGLLVPLQTPRHKARVGRCPASLRDG
jgi:hypothetical protein